jgi:hypothetical protein
LHTFWKIPECLHQESGLFSFCSLFKLLVINVYCTHIIRLIYFPRKLNTQNYFEEITWL